MARVVVFSGPRAIALIEQEEQPLGASDVRIQTCYSGISAGTELTAYRGSNPYLNKRWDPVRRLFMSDVSSLAYPLEGWGYEDVGEVIEVGSGVTRLTCGVLVWGTWGHRSNTVAAEEQVASHILPTGLVPLSGVFAHIGAIALNAVLDADIHVGETVAVFGQGVPGLIAAQLARLNGAEVIAVDGIPRRLELARKLGAAQVIDFTRESPAERIKAMTGGRGADVSIEFSGAYQALHEAIRATAYNSRVISAGFFQGNAAGLSLGEEFHHNRIQVICSQISGVAPHLNHRWDRTRLQQTIMRLAAAGRLELEALVSHVLPVERADEAFALLDQRPAEALQVVLKFSS